MAHIAVIGSLNMDVVSEVHQFPKPGETIKSNGTTYGCGGKGANQALAAAKAGAQVSMVGAVGDDAFGSVLIHSLAAYGVNTQHIAVKPGSSGLATITVNGEGENTIVLTGGANDKVAIDEVQASLEQLGHIDMILLQNEVPWAINRFTMEWARTHGIAVCFNPAPAMVVPDDMYAYLNVLVLNQTEAECATGIEVSGVDAAGLAADKLIAQGVEAVILTLGEAGAYYRSRDGEAVLSPAFRVDVVDTTAAGDTFIGAWSAARTEGKDVASALRFASAAAALAVSQEGAQQSIPARDEIEQMLGASR
ncbi:ribokinase [Paenibacillus whitsoniae]|uniref:Ribokinase n=1 Tax=Paenibacillus whitsoniae TaxID=2496558 RepID=A0A3S0C5S4_9BACL|nr:ribokinase [Paenibacillus whitsoniae]RTE04398.1 ribokinase [Paenibacillus whitsoniae]